MIAILCPTDEDAKADFLYFLSMLEYEEPWRIQKVYPLCNCIETDEDLRYIFINYRFEPVFEEMDSDILDSFHFFANVDLGGGYR